MGKVADRVVAVAKEKGAEMIVLGLPRNMDGTEGARAQKSRKLGGMIEEKSGLPVRMWDERQTTITAAGILSENVLSFSFFVIHDIIQANHWPGTLGPAVTDGNQRRSFALGEFLQQRAHMPRRNGVGDTARIGEHFFLGLLDEHLVDDANHPSAVDVVKRAAAVTRIGRRIELIHVIGIT